MESKITLPTNSSLPAILDTRNQTLALVEIIVQILILILALLGNSFVLYALLKQRKIRPWSRVYLFMAHLSFADLLVAIFNILPQLIWDITFRFRAGDLMCRCVKYLQVFVLYLSTYILVAMSIDRYLAIQSIQTGYCDTARTFRVMIAIAWLLSILFAVPQTVIFGLKEVKPNSGIYDCWATFAPNWDKVYVTWFVVSVFGIPLLVIIFCYGTICFKIWKYKPSSSNFIVHYATSVEEGAQISGDCQLPNDTSSPSQRKVKFIENDAVSSSHREHNSISRAKIKTIKLTLTVVICFFLCWSPFMGTQLILTFDPPTSDFDVGPVETILLLLASLNSCTNPWIYLAFSGSLLNQLRIWCGLGLRRSEDNESVGDEDPEPRLQQASRKTLETTVKSCLGNAGSQTN